MKKDTSTDFDTEEEMAHQTGPAGKTLPLRQSQAFRKGKGRMPNWKELLNQPAPPPDSKERKKS
jgi:hypothetical protein